MRFIKILKIALYAEFVFIFYSGIRGKSTVPPTIFVYDENLQLVEKYKGLRNIEVILEALEKGRK